MSSDPDQQSQREPDQPRRRFSRRRLLLVVGATVVLIVAAGALFAGYFNWRLGQIPRYDVNESEAAEGEPENYLVVGSDSRDVIAEDDEDADGFLGDGAAGSGQRADVIMVLRIHPNGKRIEILSIPRDLWIEIADTGKRQRINTAYGGEAGAQQLIDTIEDGLGIPIHHYAEINFRGFEQLVEEVGGVPMYFDQAYRDRNSGLSVPREGCYVLSGRDALAFVRARHLEYKNENGFWVTDPTGDLGRVQRQQIFMRNALSKAKGKANITNPGEYDDLIDVAIDNVHLSDDVDLQGLRGAIEQFANYEGEGIAGYTLPVEEFTTDGGAAVVRVKQAEAQPILNTFRGLPPDHIEPSSVDVQVLNGSGVKGQAGEATTGFETAGFVTETPGDVPGSAGQYLPTTRIRYAPGGEALGGLVQRYLTAGGELVADEEVPAGTVIVETGQDYTGVLAEPRDASDDTSDRAGTDTADTTAAEVTTTTVFTAAKTPGEIPPDVTCE
jgi:LCP family protein required for cell wall assembly